MSRKPENGSGRDDSNESPVKEIKELRVEPHPELEGRVLREINRRTLAADSLDFSLNVMLQTFWEHVHSLIDAWPGKDPTRDEDD